MDELLKSIASWLRERANGSFYFTLFLSYAIVEYKKHYILFWSDSIPSNLTRLEYARSMSITSLEIPDISLFFGVSLYNIKWLNYIVQSAFDFTLLVFLVSTCVFVFIYILPQIHLIALKQQTKDKYTRVNTVLKIKNDSYKTIETKLDEVRDSQIIIKRKSADVEKADLSIQESLPDPKRKEIIDWEHDYESTHDVHFLIKRLRDVIYGYDGYIGNPDERRLEPNDIAQAEALGLISFSNRRDTIIFTEKGLYFSKLFDRDLRN